ncbi:MAG: hypothetical protein E7813_11300 [Bradyrhizobium sp.]|uniref:hypothetical protein n=1 Tax=Bradyrhizobium sp. TaxID=376 RepID=UPI0011F44609|nr:hypothetical protein [Bradyrhizobium sp.]THD68215.1 MAG: hypothetical protein E7813_11300 [Bradyrhizobium sp.]
MLPNATTLVIALTMTARVSVDRSRSPQDVSLKIIHDIAAATSTGIVVAVLRISGAIEISSAASFFQKINRPNRTL